MSNFWFQSARGRAMVRNRSMRKARAIKRLFGTPHSQYKTEWEAQNAIRQLVQRARRANKDWRQYRQWYEEIENYTGE